MASEEHHPAYNEEDLDEEDEDVDSQNDVVDDDDEDVEDDDDDSTSSSNLAATTDPDPPPAPIVPPPISSAREVTIAVAGDPSLSTQPDPKRQRIDVAVVEEKKVPLPLDESRRLFQRLWTDEDEIELLQGFLDYTSHRGPHQHHDTSAFYDQIKSKLQLDFNKNQLVEKLRRLKKKYRNVLNKIGSGKEYVFKSPHDQATFEISCKIWSVATGRGGATAAHAVGEDTGFDDEETNLNINPNIISNDHNSNNNGLDINSSDRKGSRSRKRPRAVKMEERPHLLNSPAMPQPVSVGVPTATAGSIPSLIEETVRSCLSPLFKELLHSVMNGPCNSRGFGLTLSPMPLGFGGPLNFTGGGDVTDEKWRKQQILELEVYSKRLELVQEQIKAQLEELRSMGGS